MFCCLIFGVYFVCGEDTCASVKGRVIGEIYSIFEAIRFFNII